MSVLTRRLMTGKELRELPDDGYRYELVKGELRTMTPAGRKHGEIAMTLGIMLGSHVRTHRLGTVCAAETGFYLSRDPDTVRAPDVSFVAQERIPVEADVNDYWPIAPDLAVEVVSPSERTAEVLAKVAEYLEAGTQLVWVVYPQTQTIVVYRPSADVRLLSVGDTLEGGDVVPGFACPVAEVFA